jgi:hypothetical protein
MDLTAASWLLTVGMITFFVLRGAQSHYKDPHRVRFFPAVGFLLVVAAIIVSLMGFAHFVLGLPFSA